MNVINEIQRINALELEKGLTHTSGSWHTKYKDSSWVYAGNLPNNLTEGDIICIVSQYGEIEDINLVRDSDTGKSKGFAFIKYEDARSCVLAVDNLTGSQVLGRTLRVDHVEKYRLPKHLQEKEDENEKGNGNDDNDGVESASSNNSGVAEAGHAYKDQELASSFNIQSGQDLFASPPPPPAAQKNESNGQSSSSNAGDIGMGSGDEKEERKRRKLLRAQKRREKEEHKRKKEERKRRKKHHDSSSSKHKSSHRDR